MSPGPAGRAGPDAEQLVTSFAPDQAVAQWFLGVSSDRPELVDFATVLAVALHPWAFRVAVTGVAVVAWREGRRRTAVVVAAVMAGGGALGLGLKLLIARPRPAWGDSVATELGYSMPSGHALNAALGSGLLLVLGWPWLRARRRTGLAVGTAVVVGAVTALDRMVLGVHYLSDVLVGAGLGTVLALAAARLVRHLGAMTKEAGHDEGGRP